MSDAPQGPDWWQGTDGKWYPPMAQASAPPVAGPRPPTPPKRPQPVYVWLILAAVGIVILGTIVSAIGSGGDKFQPAASPTTTAAAPSTTPTTAATTTAPVGPAALELLTAVPESWATGPKVADELDDPSVVSQASASYLTDGAHQVAVVMYVLDPSKAQDFTQRLAMRDGDGFLGGHCGDRVAWQQISVKEGVGDVGPYELEQQVKIGEAVKAALGVTSCA